MKVKALLAALVVLLQLSCTGPGPRNDAQPPAAEPAPVAVPAANAIARIEPVASEALSIELLPWREAAVAERIRNADRLVERQRAPEALTALGETLGAAAALVRARALRLTGKPTEAGAALEEAAVDTALLPLVALERGLLAVAANDAPTAVTQLDPLLDGAVAVARLAALPLLTVLPEQAPQRMLERAAALGEVLPPDEADARSLWIEAQARAHDVLKQPAEATAMRLRRYLEEPVSQLTPAAPPEGTAPAPRQLLGRAEALLEAHRNERVLEELEPVSSKPLNAAERCRRDFALGLAARKLRKYSTAERYLTQVVDGCKGDLVRRAMYLDAKVISIRSGLRAIPMIERFAKQFGGHSMVDDVLFWAGDMYQRRARWDEAVVYYRRIEKLKTKGDYCGEARWRTAWIDKRRGRTQAALAGLRKILAKDGCAPARFDRARARYWMARLEAEGGHTPEAVKLYRAANATEPLGFYGQMSLARLQELDAVAAEQVIAGLPVPKGEATPALCPGFLVDTADFAWALELLVRGLHSDAARVLLSINVPEQKVLGSSHAASLGLATKSAKALATQEAAEAQATPMCDEAQPRLLLALLLDRAGAHRDAHWRLRTDFADTLAKKPSDKDAVIWRAAYPLAFRDYIAPAEKEAGLPSLFLQALSREESALDPLIVSWAGAYGLTQLLLSSGQAAGKLLKPPVNVSQAEELLEPALNARLGAALLASEVRKLGNNPALALAAYNAGDDVALTWWKRHQGQRFDIFAEEMTIKETRGYVKRVLKTFGIYRWLYDNAPPVLPIDATIPPR